MYADNNKNKEAKKYNGSDSEITKLDSKNRTEVDAVIEEIKRELRTLFVKTDEQIKKARKCTKESCQKRRKYLRGDKECIKGRNS